MLAEGSSAARCQRAAASSKSYVLKVLRCGLSCLTSCSNSGTFILPCLDHALSRPDYARCYLLHWNDFAAGTRFQITHRGGKPVADVLGGTTKRIRVEM